MRVVQQAQPQTMAEPSVGLCLSCCWSSKWTSGFDNTCYRIVTVSATTEPFDVAADDIFVDYLLRVIL